MEELELASYIVVGEVQRVLQIQQREDAQDETDSEGDQSDEPRFFEAGRLASFDKGEIDPQANNERKDAQKQQLRSIDLIKHGQTG